MDPRPTKRQRSARDSSYHDAIPMPDDFEQVHSREGRLKRVGNSVRTASVDRTTHHETHSWRTTTSWAPFDDIEFALDPGNGALYAEVVDADVMETLVSKIVQKKRYERSKVSVSSFYLYEIFISRPFSPETSSCRLEGSTSPIISRGDDALGGPRRFFKRQLLPGLQNSPNIDARTPRIPLPRVPYAGLGLQIVLRQEASCKSLSLHRGVCFHIQRISKYLISPDSVGLDLAFSKFRSGPLASLSNSTTLAWSAKVFIAPIRTCWSFTQTEYTKFQFGTAAVPALSLIISNYFDAASIRLRKLQPRPWQHSSYFANSICSLSLRNQIRTTSIAHWRN